MIKKLCVKEILLMAIIFAPLSSFAKEKDLSYLTPTRIRALHAQALAEQKSIQTLSESLDKQQERAILLRDSSAAQLKDLEEMNLAQSEVEQKKTEAAEKEAAGIVNTVEERVKTQVNTRQGFSEVE